MNRKMVLLDVDGTILAGDTLPRDAADAIRTLRARGHLAVFFTGRPYLHVPAAVRELGFDGCICTFGGYIRIGQCVLQDFQPPAGEARAVVQLVREKGLDAVYEASDGVWFDLSRPLPPFLRELKRHFAALHMDTDRSIDASPDFSFDKLCVWTNEHSDLPAFQRQVSTWLCRVGKKENMEEWAAKGISPGESARSVMRRFGVEREDCYALGDSVNDLPILRCAGHTVAMGQAPEELRKQVEFVTKPVEGGGLAFALRHYGLI